MEVIIRFCVIISSLVVIASCKDDTTGICYSNNIDEYVAWNRSVPDNIFLNPESHSGEYLCVIDQRNPYSVTFDMRAEKISKNKISRVEMSAWVKIPNPEANPQLVIDIIDKEGHSLEWLPVGIPNREGAINEWVRLYTEYDLTENSRNDFTNTFRIYVSNGAVIPVLMDDLQICFFE